MNEKIIIDTDPGIDDAMALFYALLHPRIELLGLTSVFGNVTTDQATRNAIHLLEYFGADLPVAHGSNAPITQAPNPPSHYVHGPQGLGDLPAPAIKARAIKQNAVEFICEQVNAHSGEITLCAIGPLSNIALALRHDPSITQKVKSVVLMGGSFAAGGNVTPWAEANIWNDPHAADQVFGADWPVTMVGLDVTKRAICTRQDFADLADSAPMLGGFLNRIVQFYIDFYEQNNAIAGCNLHDPAAIIALMHPELFSFENHALSVKVGGAKIGAVVAANGDRPAVRVAMQIDADAVRRQFLEMIKGGF